MPPSGQDLRAARFLIIKQSDGECSVRSSSSLYSTVTSSSFSAATTTANLPVKLFTRGEESHLHQGLTTRSLSRTWDDQTALWKGVISSHPSTPTPNATATLTIQLVSGGEKCHEARVYSTNNFLRHGVIRRLWQDMEDKIRTGCGCGGRKMLLIIPSLASILFQDTSRARFVCPLAANEHTMQQSSAILR